MIIENEGGLMTLVLAELAARAGEGGATDKKLVDDDTHCREDGLKTT